jgi:hypothetical protein
MRNYFLVLLLIAASTASAGWTKLAGNPTAGVIFYIDKSSVKVVGNNITLRELYDLNKPDTYGAKSYTATSEIDCQAGKHRTLEGQFFSGNMATGDRVWGPRPSGEWSAIAKGTLTELKSTKFCSK